MESLVQRFTRKLPNDTLLEKIGKVESEQPQTPVTRQILNRLYEELDRRITEDRG